MQLSPSAPAVAAGREFRIAVESKLGMRAYTTRCADAVGALQDALQGAQGIDDGDIRIEVKPVIELTYREGYAAFPAQLHPQASMDAFGGWVQADADAFEQSWRDRQAIDTRTERLNQREHEIRRSLS
jgi:hypothetical protein